MDRGRRVIDANLANRHSHSVGLKNETLSIKGYRIIKKSFDSCLERQNA